ncbi:MAG: DUF3857 domain-containing protein [Edaphobacter sp.]|uniref:DUF3857 domain-containing protein n=1 Tax=Edaphobacter sp. TaxID=1934404 RepID=UPI0023A578A3|nr:DUF3857 domain-containing protein [Edaphobacter sp.]MDE1176912.1 DUF3857 domain-containing protein [Edaphobacter sp.]
MRLIAVLFAFALVTLSGYGVAQQAGGAAPAPASAKSADYTSEPVVVEHLDLIYRFAADGTGSREINAVIRVQSDAAARQYGVLNFSFASNSEHVDLDYIRVRKPDGSIVETPASDAQEMPLEVTRQAPFYSDLKEKQVPVRNLRQGDKLEYKVHIVGTRADAPGQFWGQETFGLWAVILSQNIELHVPKTKYVKVWSPTVAPVKSETGDEVVYRWTGSQLESTTSKDSKLKHREIAPKGELPTIAWTTFKSWEEVGGWYRGLEADRAVPDAEIKAKVAELIAGKTTEDEKAHTLYSYVATQIRYIGVAFGVGRYQPHSASEVLRNQYGDCKDKHTLLAAMLTAAGLHPSASLIGAGIRLNEEVPAPTAFNHIITTVPINGRQVWLDTTAEVAPWEMLISSTRDKPTLVVPDTGAAMLERTPQKLPFTPFSTFTAKGTLSKDGTMTAQMEYTTRGDDEVVLRTLLRQISPGQWDELSQTLSQGMGFGGTTSHTEAGRPEQTAEPARLSYDYAREKTGDWENHRILPLFPVVFINPVDDKNPPQKYPIQLGEPRVESALSVIKLPAGWGADLPAAVHQETAFATFNKTYLIEGDTLTITRRLVIRQREVPASQWAAYKKWYDDSIGIGENFVQLTGFGESQPKQATTGDDNSNELQAAEIALQRNDLKSAKERLELVRTKNPNQIGLWAAYSQLDLREGKDESSLRDMEQELKLHPDQPELYDPLVRMQLGLKHHEDAKATLKKQIELQPMAMKPVLALAQLLMDDNENQAAAEALSSAIKKDSQDDTRPLLIARLGLAQLKTGDEDAGRATLTGLLDVSSDPLILNDTAYELTTSSGDKEMAEKGALKAIDILTTQSSQWTLSGDTKLQGSRSNLLVATWDTLGWIYFQKGEFELAEKYLHAAWRNDPQPVIGLHLGEAQEKQGKSRDAYKTYEVALSLGHSTENDTSSQLKGRCDALEKKGLRLLPKELDESIYMARRVRIPNPAHAAGIADYDLILSNGKILDVQATPDAATKIDGGIDMMRSVDFQAWEPSGAAARIRLRFILNCKPDRCELEKLPI